MRHSADGSASPRSSAGFTLVELLVIIATLGVLGSVVVMSADAVRDVATGAACRADVDVVRAAGNAFEVKYGRYPSSISELVVGEYLKEYPAGTSATSDGAFEFVTDSPPTTVTRPC